MRSEHNFAKIILFAVVITLMATTATAFRNQDSASQTLQIQRGEKRDRSQNPREPAGGQVYDVASPAQDNETRMLRINKSRRYNKQHQQTPLTELPPDVGGVGVPGEALSSPLPAQESDVVLTGRIVKAQPYLTENKTGMYSEFLIRVEEVFKNNGQTPYDSGDLVVADREGGALRLPDGRVIRFKVGSQKMPRSGRRYVLFLRRIHEDKDLSIVAGYELRNGRVIPLIIGNPLEGDDEQEFLNKLRTAIAQPQQGPGGGVR